MSSPPSVSWPDDAVLDPVGQQDHPGARAEGRQPVARSRARSGSSRSKIRASLTIVVDSPPGMTSPSHGGELGRSAYGDRLRAAASRARARCSRTSPCRASTPMVVIHDRQILGRPAVSSVPHEALPSAPSSPRSTGALRPVCGVLDACRRGDAGRGPGRAARARPDRRLATPRSRRPSACGTARLTGRPRGEAERGSTCFAVVRRGKLARDWNWGMDADHAARGLLHHQVGDQRARRHRRPGRCAVASTTASRATSRSGAAPRRTTVTVRNLLSNDSGRFWSLSPTTRDLLQGPDRTALRRRAPPAVRRPARRGPTTTRPSRCSTRCCDGRPACRSTGSRGRGCSSRCGMTHTRMSATRADGRPRSSSACRPPASTWPASACSTSAQGRVDGTRIARPRLRAGVGRPVVDRAQRGLRLPVVAQPARPAARPDRPGGRARASRSRPATGQLAPGAPPRTCSPRSGSAARCCWSTRDSRTIVVRLGRPAQPGAEAYGFAEAADGAHRRAALTGWLPAALGEPVRLRDLVDVDADHRLAQPAADLGDDVGVVEERGGLDDRLGALLPGCRT